MIDPVSMSRLKTVHPVLDATVCMLAYDYEFAVPGDSLIVAQCLRRWSDQQILWEQGRDINGDVIDQSKVVTNAPPGYSWHEFGLAVDLVPKSLIREAGWCPESPLWKKLTDLAEKRKLVCGSCWVHKDLPHVQMTGRFGVTPDAWVRTLFEQGGIAAVWKAAGISEE
jgi:peptidoglycan L-alanyl-D-glutamate endopeptidase CwlK